VLARAGTRESDVFPMQGRALVDAWRAHACDGAYADSEDDHFTLAERLGDPHDPLTAEVAKLARAAGRKRVPA
jgi:hypothetical protein